MAPPPEVSFDSAACGKPLTLPAIVMSSLPFSNLDLETTDINAITSIFDTLKQSFDVSYDLEFSYDFSSLEIFANRKINVGPTIRVSDKFHPFHLVFIQVGYSYAYARRYSFGLTYEYQTWGVANLKTDGGHVLIKPETLADKIHELLNPIEIDFPDDPGFSKKHYVVSNDEEKTRSLVNQSFRNHVNQIPVNEFIIEILNNKLIIGNRKVIEQQDAIGFAKFMNQISA